MTFHDARRQQADAEHLSNLVRQHARTKTLYMLTYPNGLVPGWTDGYAERKTAIRKATLNCLSADDYERLGTTSARWRVLYRRGYRIRKFGAVEIYA